MPACPVSPSKVRDSEKPRQRRDNSVPSSPALLWVAASPVNWKLREGSCDFWLLGHRCPPGHTLPSARAQQQTALRTAHGHGAQPAGSPAPSAEVSCTRPGDAATCKPPPGALVARDAALRMQSGCIAHCCQPQFPHLPGVHRDCQHTLRSGAWGVTHCTAGCACSALLRVVVREGQGTWGPVLPGWSEGSGQGCCLLLLHSVPLAWSIRSCPQCVTRPLGALSPQQTITFTLWAPLAAPAGRSWLGAPHLLTY